MLLIPHGCRWVLKKANSGEDMAPDCIETNEVILT